MDAETIIAQLGLVRHPEGGWFTETFRDTNGAGRAHSTAIYYLLGDHGQSNWHRVDAAEVWHWYGGAPLELTLSPDGGGSETHLLGMDIVGGQRPQKAIPAHWWQKAKSLGAWTLVGCTVAPGFEFSGFTLAPKGWEPN